MNSQGNSPHNIADVEVVKSQVQTVLDKIRHSLHSDGGDAEIDNLTPNWHLTI